MIRRSRWLVVLLALVCAPVAFGQEGGAPPTAKQDSRAMYEDIEIFRRLILQKLHQAPAIKSGATYYLRTDRAGNDLRYVPYYDLLDVDPNPRVNPNAQNDTLSLSRSPARHAVLAEVQVEGAYLKGQGIVYHLTMPPVPEAPTVKAVTPPSKQLSEWERQRRELRGEKLEQTQTKPALRRPSLTEVLLRVLADNGRNLSQLPENESLTLIVTFREPASGWHIVTDGSESMRNQPEAVADFLSQDVLRDRSTGSAWSKPVYAVPAANQPPPRQPTTVRDHLLFGDLSLKNGRNDEALKAFETALKLTGEQPQGGRELKEIYTKLAQAALAQGKVDDARKYLDQAASVPIPAPRAKPAQPAAVPLPGKLILSARKQSLDQVGAGQLSFEEFTKQVTQHYHGFGTPSGTTSGTRQSN